MGVNFLGMNIPTSAEELGANLRNNSEKTGQAMISRGQELFNAPSAAIAGFVHGLITGQAGAAPQLPKSIDNKQAAPAKAAAADGPRTVTLGNGMQVQLPSAAFLAANPATSADSALGPVVGAAAGAAPAASPSPLDVVRAAAMAHGGLSLNQLGSLSESVGRMIPPVTQKVPTMRDQAIGLGLQIAQEKAAAEMAAAQKANDPVAYKKATDDFFQNVRTLGASPNPMFDYDPSQYNK